MCERCVLNTAKSMLDHSMLDHINATPAYTLKGGSSLAPALSNSLSCTIGAAHILMTPAHVGDDTLLLHFSSELSASTRCMRGIAPCARTCACAGIGRCSGAVAVCTTEIARVATHLRFDRASRVIVYYLQRKEQKVPLALAFVAVSALACGWLSQKHSKGQV